VYRRGPPAQPFSRPSGGIPDDTRNPASLSLAQLGVVVRATWRELSWGLGTVSREVRTWRTLASTIPTAPIRRDALSALDTKRGHIDGAALFSILPRTRNRSLVRLLVAYEVIWDLLDSVNEHGAAAGQVNGRQLHLALIDALDPSRPISDYYAHHPWKDDGGYLRTLVEVCRKTSAELPSYKRVRPLLIEEASRAQVLAINHDLHEGHRDASLRAWATRHSLGSSEVSWFELTGAASASLTVHALLALAAEPVLSDADVLRTRGAYFPWVSAATTMLDSYVDQAEDAANGDHSYIAHYPTPQIATERTRELVHRSLHEAISLPRGEHHTLIVGCMLAMYLSKDSARTPAMRETTRELTRAGGTLTKLLLPILRLWRIAYAQRST
jgi:tetraprenyl-beta-curcumene synthase